MMKNKLRMPGLLALAAAAASLAFAGCKMDEEPTYTVWTGSALYADISITMSDGYFTRMELTNAQFSEWVSSSELNEYKHNWTESQIYDWFIGRGFSSTIANQERAWLMTINHGIIISRSGSVVDFLLK
ncbi:MAG: hypothetical protein LBR16_07010 [Treponema sp.]|jgi:hypothetical protein|nr:hypothetical protein [Treponema sp.]